MRLELGSFPVRSIAFGDATRWSDGHLTVNKAAALAEIRRDPRIASADLQIAAPGDSVRIWPVRDVIEPRIKVEGPGQCYPGICGRDITTVGQGRTHRLGGMGVVEVSSVNWHDAGGKAALTVSDHVARATAGLTPPEREVFELAPCDPGLPRVVYLWGVHSP